MIELVKQMFGAVVVMSFIVGYIFISANPEHMLYMGCMIFLYMIYLEVVDIANKP